MISIIASIYQLIDQVDEEEVYEILMLIGNCVLRRSPKQCSMFDDLFILMDVQMKAYKPSTTLM